MNTETHSSPATKITLPVEGMTCAACQATVQRALTKAPGVAKAAVNLMTNEATISYDPAVTGPEGLVAAINDTARPDDTYLQWLYAAGMKGHFDALGAHGPGFKAPPEVSPAEAAANPTYGGHRSFTFRRIEDLRAIMETNGDSAKQIWVLEFGWTSDEVNQAYAWHRVSEQEKADYLVRAFQWAHAHWSPWIGVMTVWNMPDSNWGPQDEQYWWGITNPDGSPRPAYTALKQARLNGTLP
jgi:copper chaperone CopZ